MTSFFVLSSFFINAQNEIKENNKVIVYAGGFCHNSKGTMIPGYWKNGIWKALNTPYNFDRPAINKLVVAGNDVYASGYMLISGCTKAGYWKNDTWIDLKPVNSQKGALVNALAVRIETNM